MIHIALLVAYTLLLAWLGLNVLLLIVLSVVGVIQETIGLARRGSARNPRQGRCIFCDRRTNYS